MSTPSNENEILFQLSPQLQPTRLPPMRVVDVRRRNHPHGVQSIRLHRLRGAI